MDIKAIILDNLSENSEVSEKVIERIVKSINSEIGKNFVSNEQYTKKTNELNELIKENKKLNADSKELEAIKEKLSAVEEDYKNYKTENEKKILELESTKKVELEAAETKYKELEASIATERTTTKKADVLKNSLLEAGADPKLIELVEKQFDIDSLELDESDKGFKNWDNVLKPIKDKFPGIFETVEQSGFKPATNTNNNKGGEVPNPWIADKDGKMNIDAQTAIFRANPEKARALAKAAGISLPSF